MAARGLFMSPDMIPFVHTPRRTDDMLESGKEFLECMKQRRSIRQFSDEPVPQHFLELAIQTAGTAPSGANLQPWTFVLISNPELKLAIRDAAEEEERKTYAERMPEAWAEVLQPLGTDEIKEHITDAPWLIVMFRHSQRRRSNGEMGPTYYSHESCGIAAGLLIASLQNMGLATLTHTPSPMGFLRELLERPTYEHAMLLMPVGYPAEHAMVPNISKKSLSDFLVVRS
jgi:iodotyrosine deiodinase